MYDPASEACPDGHPRNILKSDIERPSPLVNKSQNGPRDICRNCPRQVHRDMPEVIFSGPAGRIEGRYTKAKEPGAPIALSTHPHSHLAGP